MTFSRILLSFCLVYLHIQYTLGQSMENNDTVTSSSLSSSSSSSSSLSALSSSPVVTEEFTSSVQHCRITTSTVAVSTTPSQPSVSNITYTSLTNASNSTTPSTISTLSSTANNQTQPTQNSTNQITSASTTLVNISVAKEAFLALATGLSDNTSTSSPDVVTMKTTVLPCEDCENGWTGRFCTEDVNECEQNGTTACTDMDNSMCINTPGSFVCICVDGYITEEDGSCVENTTISHCWVDLSTVLSSTEMATTILSTSMPQQSSLTSPSSTVLSNNTTEYSSASQATASKILLDQQNSQDIISSTPVSTSSLAASSTLPPPLSSSSPSSSYSTMTSSMGAELSQTTIESGSLMNCTRCAIGWKGTRCNIDINECKQTADICVNVTNSVCENNKGSYSCVCPKGFKKQSEMECIDINECDSSPCFNNATCVDLIDMFTCNCSLGYSGRLCETEIDECASPPCLNGATCISSLANYTCYCVPGFRGRNCEENINECESSPCTRGGDCIDLINSFRCLCSDPYTGPTCDIDRVESVKPKSGPLAGGTDIIITFSPLLAGLVVSRIQFGENTTLFGFVTDTENNTITTVTPRGLDQHLNKSLTLIIMYYDGSTKKTQFNFTYFPNPVINRISPLQFIYTGGNHMYVYGEWLDVPSLSLIRVTTVNRRIEQNHELVDTAFYTDACSSRNSTTLVCVTPDITIPQMYSNLVDEQSWVVNDTDYPNFPDHISIPGRGSLYIYAGFQFDGFNGYQNLSQNVSASNLIPYPPPYINWQSEVFNHDLRLNDTLIYTGLNLRRGLEMSDYTPKAGGLNGTIVSLNDTTIVFTLPNLLPNDTGTHIGFCSPGTYHMELQIGYYTADVGCGNLYRECGSNPCRNRATCVDVINSFHCICQYDYYGDLCENQYPILTTIDPEFGPVFGGTVVRLSGDIPPTFTPVSVVLGYKDNVNITKSDTTGLNFITPPEGDDYTDVPMVITVVYDGGFNRSVGNFTYRGNPNITDFYPRQQLITGSTRLTVVGTDLDSVKYPVLTITTIINRLVKNVIVANTAVYSSLCSLRSNISMICTMPTISIPSDIRDALNKDDVRPLEFEKISLLPVLGFTFTVYTGFNMDSIPTFKNMSLIRDNSTLEMFTPPVLYPQPLILFDATRFGPIAIQGRHLTRGCSIEDYTVDIDFIPCTVLTLTSNNMTIKPNTRDKPTNPSYCGQDDVYMLFVTVGQVTTAIGCVVYQYPEIPPCESHPCQNNATCTEHTPWYNCTCTPEYYGHDCQYKKPVLHDSTPSHGPRGGGNLLTILAEIPSRLTPITVLFGDNYTTTVKSVEAVIVYKEIEVPMFDNLTTISNTNTSIQLSTSITTTTTISSSTSKSTSISTSTISTSTSSTLASSSISISTQIGNSTQIENSTTQNSTANSIVNGTIQSTLSVTNLSTLISSSTSISPSTSSSTLSSTTISTLSTLSTAANNSIGNVTTGGNRTMIIRVPVPMFKVQAYTPVVTLAIDSNNKIIPLTFDLYLVFNDTGLGKMKIDGNYTFYPNPIINIKSLAPLDHITSGGTTFTLVGENLDVSARELTVVTATFIVTRKGNGREVTVEKTEKHPNCTYLPDEIKCSMSTFEVAPDVQQKLDDIWDALQATTPAPSDAPPTPSGRKKRSVNDYKKADKFGNSLDNKNYEYDTFRKENFEDVLDNVDNKVDYFIERFKKFEKKLNLSDNSLQSMLEKLNFDTDQDDLTEFKTNLDAILARLKTDNNSNFYNNYHINKTNNLFDNKNSSGILPKPLKPYSSTVKTSGSDLVRNFFRNVANTISQTVLRRKKRDVGQLLSQHLYLGFVFDGFTKYSNLTESLPEFDIRLQNPPIISQKPNDPAQNYLYFNNSEQVVEIQGAQLLRGCQQSDYQVYIEDVLCTIANMDSNRLQIVPPAYILPTQNTSIWPEWNCTNAYRLHVHVGDLAVLAGCIAYDRSLTKSTFHKSLGYIGLAVGVALLAMLVIYFLTRSRSKKNH